VGEWADVVAGRVADDPQHPMAPYLPLLGEAPHDTGVSVRDMYFGDVLPAFDRRNTDRATAGIGLACPPVDGRMIDRYLRHFRRVGFLAPPHAPADPH
jgi:hypothetical protein